MKKEHITALKQIVVNNDYEEEKIMTKGLDFEAFCIMMQKYIQKMKGQTCWKMLNHYGYDNKLEIKRALWDDNTVSDEILRTAKSFELTREGVQYLKKLFKMYQTRPEGSNVDILDKQGIDKIFKTCNHDDGLPFHAESESEFTTGMLLELWIGLWQKAFCERPKIAFKFLVYTGYIDGYLKDVIKPIQIRTKDILG